MLTLRQADDEFPPIRITPHGVISTDSGVPPDFDTSSGGVIDVAPSDPGPIRLPPLVVTLPPKSAPAPDQGPGIAVTQQGMSGGQIVGLIVIGTAALGAAILAASLGQGRAPRRRRARAR